MHTLIPLLLAVALSMSAPAAGAAENGSVTGIHQDLKEIELYASPGDVAPLRTVTAKDVRFPLGILEVSDNGMYRLQIDGRDVWVISDDVISDRSRAIEAACEPKLAGTMVAHGKRGVGEGCK